MRTFLSVTKAKIIVCVISACIFYLSTYVIFPESVIPDEELRWFYIGIFFVLVIHEFVHAGAAIIAGTPMKNIQIGFRLEFGSGWCVIKGGIDRDRFVFVSLAPVILVTILGSVLYWLTGTVLFLMLAWVNVAFSIIDIPLAIDFLRMPRDVLFIEPDTNDLYNDPDIELNPPPGYAKDMLLSVTRPDNQELPVRRLFLLDQVDVSTVRAEKPKWRCSILSILRGHISFSFFSVIILAAIIVRIILILSGVG